MDRDRIYVDDYQDEVRELLVKLNKLDRWTAKKYELRDSISKLLKRKRYIEFAGSPYRYGLHTIGESYIYDVPFTQRGNLAKFQGKKVRLICMYSGRFSRWIMAGVVKK
jgi:hypothetical protein